MKKIFISLLAVAALAACTKSEVAYEPAGEIGFAPFTGNITKAEGKTGTLAAEQKLGVYAYWNKTVDLGTSNSVTVSQDGYAAYNDNYLVNYLFAKKGASWGGANEAYPWPVNGALVFAGYTTPNAAVLENVNYVLGTDAMTFKNYSNANEFDLCWFGRTPSAYNNRKTGTAIDVTLNHALAWVSIKVYGEGSPIGWTINSIEWKVPTVGTATCVGTSATWDNTKIPTAASDILAEDHTISANETKITDNLVIPSTPVEITVNYTFAVNGVDKTDSKTVNLKLDDKGSNWLSGVHYTYTLKFTGSEILVAPTYDTWDTEDKTVTVE